VHFIGGAPPAFAAEALAERQRAEAEAQTKAATDAHREKAEKFFVEGWEATENTGLEATCCAELLWLVKAKRSLITVLRWSPAMMGRAARTLREKPHVYLGDCRRHAVVD
jgi:hypothetical protein